MSTEQPKKELIVKIDTTATEQRIKADYETKLKEKDETIKAFLAKDALEAERKRVEADMDKKAPIGGDTAPLEQPETHEPIYDVENSELLSMLSFHNEKDAIDFLKERASNPACADYELAKKLYGKAVKRSLREGGTFEFQGNMCRFERKGDKIVKATRPQTFKRVEDE